MIILTLHIKINKTKTKLLLKDKQSIVNTLLNMHSDYGKLLHESKNNIKTLYSFFMSKNEDRIDIRIDNSRFSGLNLKSFLIKNKGKKLFVKEGIHVIINDYKSTQFNNLALKKYDILETISPIYLNCDLGDGKTGNLNVDVNESNLSLIENSVISNIKNYTGYELTSDDVTIIVKSNTRVLTGFTDKHAWSCYYITLFFKENRDNSEKIYEIKKTLMNSFYKSSYIGYFILK